MAFIEAYVTNLGKYNEGELASEPLKFPTTTEEVQALLKRIGVDNIQFTVYDLCRFFHWYVSSCICRRFDWYFGWTLDVEKAL